MCSLHMLFPLRMFSQMFPWLYLSTSMSLLAYPSSLQVLALATMSKIAIYLPTLAQKFPILFLYLSSLHALPPNILYILRAYHILYLLLLSRI